VLFVALQSRGNKEKEKKKEKHLLAIPINLTGKNHCEEPRRIN
jgi:hypothetical protein